MNADARQKELARLTCLLESGNYNYVDVQRFRELVKQEVTPRIAAEVPRIMAAAQERQRRRAAAVEAGRRAGIAAGRRYLANHRQKR